MSFSRQYPGALFPGKSQTEPLSGGVEFPAVPRLIDSLNPRSWWRAGVYLRDLRPDAIVFQYWMPFFAPAFGTVARKSVRLDGMRPRRLALVHNALPHERRPGDVALSRYFLRTCDGLITLSGSVRSDVGQIVPGVKTVERSHPVYRQFGEASERTEARRRLGLPKDAAVLLFFGFVRRYKGLDVLLNALPEIVRRHPHVHLLVAGEFYEPVERFREQIRSLGLTDHVHIENRYIAESEVPVIFGASDLVVQPYRAATQSGVAQVAFGFGVPVVTTDVGGLAESVGEEEAGLIVPPEDASSLADAVNRILDDEALMKRLQHGAKARGHSEGWEPICEAIEEFLVIGDG